MFSHRQKSGFLMTHLIWFIPEQSHHLDVSSWLAVSHGDHYNLLFSHSESAVAGLVLPVVYNLMKLFEVLPTKQKCFHVLSKSHIFV